MRAYQFENAAAEREVVVERFGGVDFSTHSTKADLAHSPDACNMIAEETDFLVKRPGYKKIAQAQGKIYGLFALPGEAGAVVHAGETLYQMGETGSLMELCTGMNAAFSFAFQMNGALYLLDGQTYRKIYKQDGDWVVQAVSESAFVPTTTIAAPPTGGGTSLEAVNLLTPKRINTFVGNGSATQFYLDAQDIDDAEVTATVGGQAVTVSSVNRSTGVVTLASAPANANGLANVAITFSKTVAGSAEKINKCRFAGLYGGKNDTRVFLAGNPDEPNCDWQSGLFDPAYFPDTGYTRIGSDAAAIVGYVRQYESQLVIKEGGGQEATQYLRTFLLDDSGKAAYPLKQGAQGAGGLAFRSFAALGDTPLFLSADGVMGVFGTAVTEQRSIRRQSNAVDARLTAEGDLQDACAVVWRDKYFLAVNGRCYVADGRVYRADGSPEWYYWDNFPAVCFAVIGGRLWFGTADGRVLRLCERDEEDAFYDDGAAIDAWWCTPDLPLGDWGRGKTVREITPVLMPYTRSGVRVTYETDAGETLALERNLDLFSFETLDFSRFTFRCRPGAVPMRVRRKLHRARTVRVRIRNNRAGEPFGLLALGVRYILGGRGV
ncbi:MAG: hypothetical protein J6L72_09270 [Butyricicoccus sp.]|nr:hypothetical protein [Butyricicoccus sp.]